jgi:uncharacterized membrane protein
VPATSQHFSFGAFLPRKTFLEKARNTYAFHLMKITNDDNWTMTMTANKLGLSVGAVSEDILIARWLKTHEKIIEKFKYRYEALKFIREKEKEMERRG